MVFRLSASDVFFIFTVATSVLVKQTFLTKV
jgi:hypothetical protein